MYATTAVGVKRKLILFARSRWDRQRKIPGALRFVFRFNGPVFTRPAWIASFLASSGVLQHSRRVLVVISLTFTHRGRHPCRVPSAAIAAATAVQTDSLSTYSWIQEPFEIRQLSSVRFFVRMTEDFVIAMHICKYDISAKDTQILQGSLPESLSLSLFFFLHIFVSPALSFFVRYCYYHIHYTVTDDVRESFESAIDIPLNVGDVLIVRLLFDNPVNLDGSREPSKVSGFSVISGRFRKRLEESITRILESIDWRSKGGRESARIMQRQFRYYGISGEYYTSVGEKARSFTIFIFYETILLKLCYGNGDTDRQGSQACTFDIKTPGPSLRLITLDNGERNEKNHSFC